MKTGIITLLIQAVFLSCWLFNPHFSLWLTFSPSLIWVTINVLRLTAFVYNGRKDRKNTLRNIKEKQAQIQALQKNRQKKQ